MNWIELIVAVVSSGGVGALVSGYATKKKVKADTVGSEINNVAAAIKIWKELAEDFKKELKHAKEEKGALRKELGQLRYDMRRLTNLMDRVTEILDTITPENLKEKVTEIKKKIQGEEN